MSLYHTLWLGLISNVLYIMNNNQQKISLSVKKALGTLQKVITMIEQDVYCADVAQQINASI